MELFSIRDCLKPMALLSYGHGHSSLNTHDKFSYWIYFDSLKLL
ncbi:hypothetical protein HMPREF1567_1807 [Providencia alcalifaciens PAL-2]|nr:hypothetical protein HMPREF1562_1696 [Providencia alcalifaciens F90-2004]EUC96071.1 hypothetical protein HMPREF1567_1807 [Providencia alcalifaciens PAL-2]EUD06979.1 hypothetical protein HMPREF1564_0348 [Providencia alcalifaciens R90-1475]